MNALLTGAVKKLMIGTLCCFLIGAAHAQTTEKDSVQKEGPVLVRFLGTNDDMVSFSVTCKNPAGDKLSIMISDQDGTLLYQNAFRDTSLHKQFKLPKADKSKITFTVRGYGQTDIIRSFLVNVNSHIVENVAVRKLN